MDNVFKTENDKDKRPEEAAETANTFKLLFDSRIPVGSVKVDPAKKFKGEFHKLILNGWTLEEETISPRGKNNSRQSR